MTIGGRFAMRGQPQRYQLAHSIRDDGATVVDLNLHRPNEQEIPVVGVCRSCRQPSTGFYVGRGDIPLSGDTYRWPCNNCKASVNVADYFNIFEPPDTRVIHARRPHEMAARTTLTRQQLNRVADVARRVGNGSAAESELRDAIRTLPPAVGWRLERYWPKTSGELAAWVAAILTLLMLLQQYTEDESPDCPEITIVNVIDAEMKKQAPSSVQRRDPEDQ